jgi:hypothetical protein
MSRARRAVRCEDAIGRRLRRANPRWLVRREGRSLSRWRDDHSARVRMPGAVPSDVQHIHTIQRPQVEVCGD